MRLPRFEATGTIWITVVRSRYPLFRSLREDLLRRDFTINAMAAGLDGTIQDPFDGQQDLKNGVIRCVGEPEQRFSEDALRILRGLRFASRLGFSIAPETAEAMRRKKLLLHYVSEERIYKELSGILMGSYASQVLRQFSDIVAVVVPEIIPSMGFQQHSPFHNRDVWAAYAGGTGKEPTRAENPLGAAAP